MKFGANKASSPECDVGEVGQREVGLRKVSKAEVGLGELGVYQVDPSDRDSSSTVQLASFSKYLVQRCVLKIRRETIFSIPNYAVSLVPSLHSLKEPSNMFIVGQGFLSHSAVVAMRISGGPFDEEHGPSVFSTFGME